MGETEPPAINDVMATTMGGICFGEITHRISRLLLNDRSRGFRRFLREFGATIIDPMNGLDRILTGKAWRVKNQYYKYHDYEALPIDFSISLGARYLADNGAMFRGDHNMFLNFFLEYGDPLNEETSKPYDFFFAGNNNRSSWRTIFYKRYSHAGTLVGCTRFHRKEL